MDTNKNLSGVEFERITCKIVSEYFKQEFNPQIGLFIGRPSKKHKFDFVSSNNSIVIECKCYSYTSTGNIPSAKISGLNEAVFYLSFLPSDTEKYLAIKKSYRNRNQETLAEYYLRTYRHLLGDVKIIEIDTENVTLKLLN